MIWVLARFNAFCIPLSAQRLKPVSDILVQILFGRLAVVRSDKMTWHYATISNIWGLIFTLKFIKSIGLSWLSTSMWSSLPQLTFYMFLFPTSGCMHSSEGLGRFQCIGFLWNTLRYTGRISYWVKTDESSYDTSYFDISQSIPPKSELRSELMQANLVLYIPA